jgi:ribose transport system permease protein
MQTEVPSIEPGRAKRKGGAGKGRIPSLSTWGPIFAFALVIVVFGAISPDVFLSLPNFLSILNDQSVLAIMACGITVVLLTGEFDMSIAAIMTTSAVLSAGLVSKNGVPPLVAVVIVFVVGALIGLFNGYVVTRFRVPALIATLAVGSVLDGLVLAYTKGEVIFNGIPKSFTALGRTSVFGIQVPIIYMILVALALWALLKYTVAGRYLYAVGGNRNAARMSGIRVNRYVISAFVIAGACAALAGVIQAARNGSAQSSVGASFLLPSFAAAFLGSATLRRGEFHIGGTILGVYLIATGASGFFILGAPYWVQYVFSGIILLIATASSGLLTKNRKNRTGKK